MDDHIYEDDEVTVTAALVKIAGKPYAVRAIGSVDVVAQPRDIGLLGIVSLGMVCLMVGLIIVGAIAENGVAVLIGIIGGIAFFIPVSKARQRPLLYTLSFLMGAFYHHPITSSDQDRLIKIKSAIEEAMSRETIQNRNA